MKYLSCQILSNLANQKYLPNFLAKKHLTASSQFCGVVGGLGCSVKLFVDALR